VRIWAIPYVEIGRIFGAERRSLKPNILIKTLA